MPSEPKMSLELNTDAPKFTPQSRLRSKVAWGAVIALALLIGDSFGLWPALGITNQVARAILDGVLAVAAGFGAFNDPTNKAGW